MMLRDNFDIGGVSINISCQIPNENVLAQLGLKSKVLPGSLNKSAQSRVVNINFSIVGRGGRSRKMFCMRRYRSIIIKR